jgi:hypothetical protein
MKSVKSKIKVLIFQFKKIENEFFSTDALGENESCERYFFRSKNINYRITSRRKAPSLNDNSKIF